MSEEKTKQPYERPQLVRINLRPEEAVLGNCKLSGASGPASGSCAALSCKTLGS